MNFRISKKIIAGIFVTLLCALGLAYYVLAPRESILNYEIQRDKKFILSLFDKDWYWLSGYTREESDTDLFLERMSPSEEPQHAGKLVFKVMYANKQPAGFVGYYMKSAREGTILFIDVAHAFRRHHYGRKLLDYAVDALAQQGAAVVRLVTRTNNIPAQTLYKRAGFRETGRDDTYVFFEKRIV